MISRQMPRIVLGSEINTEEITQALALTYLSQYCNETLDDRVRQCFFRAFGMDYLWAIPDNGDNKPGCILSSWENDDGPQMHVAIHGVQGVGSVWELLTPVGYSAITGLAGSLWTAFKTAADDLLIPLSSGSDEGRLASNESYVRLKSHRRLTITFSGHSLGAAMAELMAYRFKDRHESADVRLIKFGSPRVGNAAWRDNRNRYVKFASVYNGRDPIHYFPWIPSELSFLTLGAANLVVRSPARDDAPMRLDPDEGRIRSTYLGTWSGAEIDAGLFAFRSHVFSNAWYDHSMNSYRLSWMSYLAQMQDAAQYRFNFLEHPDENNWHQLFTPGMRQWESLTGFSGGGDADPIAPIAPRVEQLADAPAPAPRIAPIAQDDGLLFGPFRSDFSAPPVANITRRPTRRVRVRF